jgi:hypothetical protein
MTSNDILIVTVTCKDCCEGIIYEEAGVSIEPVSESMLKSEVKSTIEVDYTIGVDEEKTFKNIVKTPNC